MKLACLVLLLALAYAAEAARKCSLDNGNQLVPFSGGKGKMDVPCKYPVLRQQCGEYFIRVTPGSVYVRRYFINTVWFKVEKNGKSWEARTSSKIAVKFINDTIGLRDAFHQKSGDLNPDEEFDFTKTGTNLTIAAKDGSFSFTFGPYDPLGTKHKNVGFEFTCNREDPASGFPEQFCGGDTDEDLKRKADALGYFKCKNLPEKCNGVLKDDPEVKTYYFHLFTDDTIDQTPSPKCALATNYLINGCKNDTQRADAIEKCYRILYSSGHRKCATMFSCELMDVFSSCINFVCTGNDTACYEVASAIDNCRDFKGLSSLIQEAGCYKGFLPLPPQNSNEEE